MPDEKPSAALDMQAVDRLFWTCEGGIYKRIDEIRELLELLMEKCPAVLLQHNEILMCLQSQDVFLTRLLELIPHLQPLSSEAIPSFPRDFPSIEAQQAILLSHWKKTGVVRKKPLPIPTSTTA